MDERRKRQLKIAAMALVIAIIALVLYLVFRTKPASTVQKAYSDFASTTNAELTDSSNRVAAVQVNPVALPPPPASKQPEAVRVAEVFASRYGSFSNQEVPFQNLTDLIPIMTDEYRAKVEAQITSVASAPAEAYDGVTSVRVSTKIVSESASAAVVEVSLQQTRTNPSGTSVGYRTLRLNMKSDGDKWLVDAVNWTN